MHSAPSRILRSSQKLWSTTWLVPAHVWAPLDPCLVPLWSGPVGATGRDLSVAMCKLRSAACRRLWLAPELCSPCPERCTPRGYNITPKSAAQTNDSAWQARRWLEMPKARAPQPSRLPSLDCLWFFLILTGMEPAPSLLRKSHKNVAISTKMGEIQPSPAPVWFQFPRWFRGGPGPSSTRHLRDNAARSASRSFLWVYRDVSFQIAAVIASRKRFRQPYSVKAQVQVASTSWLSGCQSPE